MMDRLAKVHGEVEQALTKYAALVEYNSGEKAPTRSSSAGFVVEE